MMLVSFIPDANFPSSIPGIQSTLGCVNIFAQTLRDNPTSQQWQALALKNINIFYFDYSNPFVAEF